MKNNGNEAPMRATNTRPLIAIATLGVSAVLLLTGCSGGNTASGTFYGETKSGTDSIVSIDGDTVTWGESNCDFSVGEIDPNDSETSVGTLDKDRVQIAWTKTGNFYDTDPFTQNEGGDLITIGVGSYSKAGTAAADALISQWEENCAEIAETQKKREAAEAEQAEADAKIKPTFDKALSAILGARRSGSADTFLGDNGYEEFLSILAQNGTTEEEFSGYLGRNYSGLDAYDLLNYMSGKPEHIEEMLEEMREGNV